MTENAEYDEHCDYSPSDLDEELSRVLISKLVTEETNELTVTNENTPSTLASSKPIAFSDNNRLRSPAVGETTASTTSQQETTNKPNNKVIGIEHGFAQDSLENKIGRDDITNENTHDFSVKQDTINYIRADWFDNGKPIKSIRGTVRHKINIHFNFKPRQKFQQWTIKICAENRYWKRNIDIDDPFYTHIWDWYEESCMKISTSKGFYYDVNPRLGHIHFDQQIIPYAEAMFFKIEKSPATVLLWIEDFFTTIEIDNEPKGRVKCKALQAYGIYQRINEEIKPTKITDLRSALQHLRT